MTDTRVFDGEKELKFPAGFSLWRGSSDGGVRKPFRKDSGRPAGEIITPLLTRLQAWATELANGTKNIPHAILLVGGPGNGKTDAVGTCIEYLDEAISAGGKLYESFAVQFRHRQSENALPPRRVDVNLPDLGIPRASQVPTPIRLVQDATENDSATTDKSAEELLLDELCQLLRPDSSGVYICCVNRGVLAQASIFAHEQGWEDGVRRLLDQILQAVTNDPESPSCWPLAGYPRLAVWPMDVESLVEPGEDGRTVAHQIFDVALDETRWQPQCEAGARCPFCQNRKLLSRKGAVDHLIRFLRYFELASGKRWTFRDLFSLVPYLLVGDYSELEIKGKPVSPCEWAAAQLEIAKSGRSGDPARARAPYLLVSRLYHHRLFPRWPSLDRPEYRLAKSILHEKSLVNGIEHARDFFRYVAHATTLTCDISGETTGRLRGPLSEFLDPALASGDTELFSRGGEPYTVNRIDELFSLSVREGFGEIDSQIEPLERDLFQLLAEADDALVEESFPRTKSHHVSLLRSSLRQFCARLAKRSIGTRRGVCHNLEYFEKYQRAMNDARGLIEVRKQLRKLLHDGRNRFRASLVTTFGQPVAQRSREVVLLTQSVFVKELGSHVNGGRPPDPLPYLRVDKKNVIPVTFPLFKALHEVVAGLHDASLPSEIFALLNGVRSLVAGHVVRDKAVLDDGAWIELGNSDQAIEIIDGDFHIAEVDRE